MPMLYTCMYSGRLHDIVENLLQLEIVAVSALKLRLCELSVNSMREKDQSEVYMN